MDPRYPHQHGAHGYPQGAPFPPEVAQNVVEEVDLYERLELKGTASKTDIKKAYHRMARRVHPDKAPDHGKGAAEAKFKDVKEAYEILSDDDKRRIYDAHGMDGIKDGLDDVSGPGLQSQGHYTQTGHAGHFVPPSPPPSTYESSYLGSPLFAPPPYTPLPFPNPRRVFQDYHAGSPNTYLQGFPSYEPSYGNYPPIGFAFGEPPIGPYPQLGRPGGPGRVPRARDPGDWLEDENEYVPHVRHKRRGGAFRPPTPEDQPDDDEDAYMNGVDFGLREAMERSHLY